jgi:hypothetical protein
LKLTRPHRLSGHFGIEPTGTDSTRAQPAHLEDRGGAWWGEFFADRAKPCPFFVEWPDENLVAWFSERLLNAGRVLKLGCGHERASLGGGLGYSEDHLRSVWDKAPFSLRVLRQMNQMDGQGPYFGEDFLWVLLATKEAYA